MTLRLYDLAGAQPERRFSPYCWRIRLALAHKNIATETIPWRFTEKAEIAASGQTLVPVLVDGDRWISGSWTIANYLEDTFPDSPSLFGGVSGRGLTRFYSNSADSLVSAIFPFVAFDILQHVADKDREYYRVARSGRAKRSKPWSTTVTHVCLHFERSSRRCALP
jgi:glutathione S-transferase